MNLKRKVLATLTAMTLAFSGLVPITATAALLESSDEYNDLELAEAIAHFDGTGTAEDPFQISTADDLYYINYIEYWRDTENSSEIYYYEQQNDIDISKYGSFDKEYGYITANFAGVYDGNDLSITGLSKPLFYCVQGTSESSGLSSYTSGSYEGINTAIVKNLTISEPEIEQSVATNVIDQIAAVAVSAAKASFYNINVEGGSISGITGAAAIVGYEEKVVIDKCSSSSDISASTCRASGIAATLYLYSGSNSIITDCTFSGTITSSVNDDTGVGGILGGAYTYITSGSLPLYVTNNTVSGATFNITSTGSKSSTGGVVGVISPYIQAVLTGNTVTNTTMNVTGESYTTNVGELIGSFRNSENTITHNIKSNTISGVTVDASGTYVYIGETAGCYSGLLSGNFTITEQGSGTYGTYGNLANITVNSDLSTTDITLPANEPDIVIYVLDDGSIGSITNNSTGNTDIYNVGTVGDLSNTGAVRVYANSGNMGSVTSTSGTVRVGDSSVTDGTTKYGNTGTIGAITASDAIEVYRNAENASITSLESTSSGVTIGQSSTTYMSYNTNAGTIGSVSAAGNIGIYAANTTGKIATGDSDSITADGIVTIGSGSIQCANTLGNVTAGTSMTVFASAGTIGDLTAGTSIEIGLASYLNGANIGAVNAGTFYLYNGTANVAKTGGITTAGETKVNVNNGTVGDITCSASSTVYVGGDRSNTNYEGNAGTTGNIKSKNAISVYRNTGTIGDLETETGNIMIGQNNASYSSYNTNSGTIGSVKSARTVTVYTADKSGSIATGDDDSISAGTTVNIGSTSVRNGNTIGDVSAAGDITVYSASAAIGDIANSGSTATTVTIGSTSYPNEAVIDSITNTAGTVTGYTTAKVGTVTAATDSLVRAYDETASTASISDTSVTITSTEDGKVTVNDETYDSGLNLVLTSTSDVTVTFDSSSTYTASLSSIQASTASNKKLTLLDGGAKASIGSITAGRNVVIGNATTFSGTIGSISSSGSVTLGTSSYCFPGTVTGDISGTGVTIYNAGTIGTSGGNTITATSGTISVTNGIKNDTSNTAYIYSDILDNSSSARTVSVTNYSYAMTGKITNNTTGLTTLNGNYSNTSGDLQNFNKFTGDIAVAGDLKVNSNIGPNSVSDPISVQMTDGAAITIGDSYYCYLKISEEKSGDITTLAVTSLASQSGINTVDLSNLTGLTTVTKTESTSGATAFVYNETASATPDTSGSYGTRITTIPVSEDLSGDRYYIGNSFTVNSGCSVSSDGTLTLTSENSTTVYNYGTIGTLNYTGGNNLTIYNMGSSAKIGKITANSGVAVLVNGGEIGDITATAGSVVVGASNATGTLTYPSSGGTTYDQGNDGKIGNITASTGINVYRNAKSGENTGVIGDLTAESGSITIGRNDASYSSYNTNSGTIGSITAEAGAVNIYTTDTNGTIAVGTDEKITAGTSVAIGYSTSVINGNTIGSITAGGSIKTFYNAGTIGDVTAAGEITLLSNSGTITSLESTGDSVTVGQASTLNTGTVSAVKAAKNITLYNSGTIGTAESSGGQVAVGSSSALNAGSVGAITASTTSTVYNGDNGSIASITAGGEVTVSQNTGTIGKLTSTGAKVKVGSRTESNNVVTVVPNSGTITAIDAGTSVEIYNDSSGTIGTTGTVSSQSISLLSNEADITAAGAVTIYANAGTIGSVASTGSTVTVGQSNQSSDSNGYTGNTGTIGDITAYSTASIYRNTGTIGDVESEASEVTIGQNSSTSGVQTYNTNSGTIGSVTAETNIGIYATNTSGTIAVESGESVTSGAALTIGSSSVINGNTIGTAVAGTTATVYNAGTISDLTVNGESATLYVYDSSTTNLISGENTTVAVYDKTTSSGSAVVNITAESGSVGVDSGSYGNASVYVYVPETQSASETLNVAGTFEAIVHSGEGTVIMTTSTTYTTSAAELSSGEILIFGGAGEYVNLTSVSGANESYYLSLVETSTENVFDIYLVSKDGTALAAGTVSNLTVVSGSAAAALTDSGSTYTITGGGRSEKIGTLTVTDTSNDVTVTASYTPPGGSEETDITGTITAASMNSTDPDTYYTIASKVYVVFEKVNGEDSTYYIKLSGKSSTDYLYRYMAAQLAFELEGDGAAYEIKPYGNSALTTATIGGKTVYAFHLTDPDMNTEEKAITVSEIIIGTVTFSGVSNGFTFTVDDEYADNQIRTAEFNYDTSTNSNNDNSIVKTYSTEDENLVIQTDLTASKVGTIDSSLTLTETALTINVVFPNAVSEQGTEYTDMKVKVTGLGKDGEKYSFGGTSQSGTDIVYASADKNNEATALEGYSGYSTTVNVYKGYSYQLEFSGAGYRTYRTTIVPTDTEAAVTVWNNAMDDEMVVISQSSADSAVYEATTFLAGEIIADNGINLYDLSAVVSYFGKSDISTTALSDDTKYDLNRDGKIDSKDIAMVLVSWGK